MQQITNDNHCYICKQKEEEKYLRIYHPFTDKQLICVVCVSDSADFDRKTLIPYSLFLTIRQQPITIQQAQTVMKSYDQTFTKFENLDKCINSMSTGESMKMCLGFVDEEERRQQRIHEEKIVNAVRQTQPCRAVGALLNVEQLKKVADQLDSPLQLILRKEISQQYFKLLDDQLTVTKRYNYVTANEPEPLTLKNITNGTCCLSVDQQQNNMIFIYHDNYYIVQPETLYLTRLEMPLFLDEESFEEESYEEEDDEEEVQEGNEQIFKGLGLLWFLGNEKPGMKTKVFDKSLLKTRCQCRGNERKDNYKECKVEFEGPHYKCEFLDESFCKNKLGDLECKSNFIYNDTIIQPYFFRYN